MIREYMRIKKEIENNDLDLFFVISPPRTGSTLLAKSISLNSKIKDYLHEPCFNLKYISKDSNLVYKNFLQKGNIIIKDMAQWMDINNEYMRLLGLTNKPPIILIRNPIISTESKLRRFIMTFTLRDKYSLHKFLKEYFLESNDLKNFNELVENKSLCEKLRFYTPLLNSKPSDGKCSKFHKFLLDFYALKKSNLDWDMMVSQTFEERDYNYFDTLIDNEDIFPLFELGWESLIKIVNYLEGKKKYIIIDNTEFRLAPKEIMYKICCKWDLNLEEIMLNWGILSDFSLSQEKSYQKIWYATLKQSKRILDPSEIPLCLDRFPNSISSYLLDKVFPIYLDLFYNKNKISTKEDILSKEIIVPLDKLVNMRLNDLGKTKEEVEKSSISNEKFDELIFDKDYEDYDGIRMCFKDVDPIFSCLFDNSLFTNRNFIEKNKRYNNVLKRLARYG